MSEILPDYSPRRFDDTILKNTKFWEGWWTARKIRKEAAQNGNLASVVEKHLASTASNREKALTLKALRWLSDNEIKGLSHLKTYYLEMAKSLANNQNTILAFEVALFSKDLPAPLKAERQPFPLSDAMKEIVRPWQIPLSLNEKLSEMMKKDRAIFLAKFKQQELIKEFKKLIDNPAIMDIKDDILKQECIRLYKQIEKTSQLTTIQENTLRYSVFLLSSIYDKIAAVKEGDSKAACIQLNREEKPSYATLKAVVDRFEVSSRQAKGSFLEWLSPRSLLFLLPYLSQEADQRYIQKHLLILAEKTELNGRIPLLAFLDKYLSDEELPLFIQQPYRALWDALIPQEATQRAKLPYSEIVRQATMSWRLPEKLTDYHKIALDEFSSLYKAQGAEAFQQIPVPDAYLILLPALLKETVNNKKVTSDERIQSLINNLRDKNEAEQREVILTLYEDTLQKLTETLLKIVPSREVSIKGDEMIAMRRLLGTFPAIDAENLIYVAKAIPKMSRKERDEFLLSLQAGSLLYLIPLLADTDSYETAINAFLHRYSIENEAMEKEKYIAFLDRYLSEPNIPYYIRTSYRKVWDRIANVE